MERKAVGLSSVYFYGLVWTCAAISIEYLSSRSPSSINRSLDGSANPRWKITRLLGKNCFSIKKNPTGYHPGSKLPSRAEWSQLFRLFLTQSLSQHRFSLKLWLQRLAPQLLRNSLFARGEFWITVWVEYDSHLMWVNVSCSCSKSSLESLSRLLMMCEREN